MESHEKRKKISDEIITAADKILAIVERAQTETDTLQKAKILKDRSFKEFFEKIAQWDVFSHMIVRGSYADKENEAIGIKYLSDARNSNASGFIDRENTYYDAEVKIGQSKDLRALSTEGRGIVLIDQIAEIRKCIEQVKQKTLEATEFNTVKAVRASQSNEDQLTALALKRKNLNDHLSAFKDLFSKEVVSKRPYFDFLAPLLSGSLLKESGETPIYLPANCYVFYNNVRTNENKYKDFGGATERNLNGEGIYYYYKNESGETKHGYIAFQDLDPKNHRITGNRDTKNALDNFIKAVEQGLAPGEELAPSNKNPSTQEQVKSSLNFLKRFIENLNDTDVVESQKEFGLWHDIFKIFPRLGHLLPSGDKQKKATITVLDANNKKEDKELIVLNTEKGEAVKLELDDEQNIVRIFAPTAGKDGCSIKIDGSENIAVQKTLADNTRGTIVVHGLGDEHAQVKQSDLLQSVEKFSKAIENEIAKKRALSQVNTAKNSNNRPTRLPPLNSNSKKTSSANTHGGSGSNNTASSATTEHISQQPPQQTPPEAMTSASATTDTTNEITAAGPSATGGPNQESRDSALQQAVDGCAHALSACAQTIVAGVRAMRRPSSSTRVAPLGMNRAAGQALNISASQDGQGPTSL